MSFLPFVFANPLMLAALVALPAIWWLLRMTPPKPVVEVFPPLRILASVLKREETPSKSPWWLTLLRMLMAAAIILAIADPVFNPRTNTLSGNGPLALVIDNSWATSSDWQRRVETAEALIGDAEAKDLPVAVVFTADQDHNAVPGSALTARNRLAAAAPQPLRPDREAAIGALKTALNGTAPGTLAFLSDGIEAGDGEIMAALAALSPQNFRLIQGSNDHAVATSAIPPMMPNRWWSAPAVSILPLHGRCRSPPMTHAAGRLPTVPLPLLPVKAWPRARWPLPSNCATISPVSPSTAWQLPAARSCSMTASAAAGWRC